MKTSITCPLNGGATRITVDYATAAVTDVCHRGRHLLVPSETSLFTVQLRSRDGTTRRFDAGNCSFVSFTDGCAVYENAQITVRLRLRSDGAALRFRAEVENRTDDLPEWVELMTVEVGGKLRDEEGGRGAIVWPWNEGCLVSNMSLREKMPHRYREPVYPSRGSYSIFPNMICSQFLAYEADGAGLYLGMHDPERTTKHIDFCYGTKGIRLQMRVFCNAGYGEGYTMPFDCVMQPFDGDWHDACEIYRTWLEAHLPKGLCKIRDNLSLPAWYGDSPLVVTYPVRGTHDTGDMTPGGFFPYVRALPFLEKIAEKTDSTVMALLMHWEGTAPWAPPYVWPPYGGETPFSEFVREAHKKNMTVGLYASGLGWTMKSHLTDYDRTADFARDGIADIVCTDSDGRAESVICTAQREGYDLCPACEKTKRILSREISRVCASGIDYMQVLDQNHGGTSYFCYSDRHGHVPAPGKWQTEEGGKLLDSIDRRGVLFGCESAAAEPNISRLAFSDNRFELNYYSGTPIPLYAYLYHEYVNNFMGNQICAMLDKCETNYTLRAAYSFAAGDMLTAVFVDDGGIRMKHSWCDWIAPKEKTVDEEVALSFLRTLNGWRRKGGKPFLHTGRMTRPMPVACGENRYTLDGGHDTFTAPEVLTAAYTADGRTVQFLVNYNLHEVTATLPEAVGGYTDSDLTQQCAPTREWTLAPLSVVMLERPTAP